MTTPTLHDLLTAINNKLVGLVGSQRELIPGLIQTQGLAQQALWMVEAQRGIAWSDYQAINDSPLVDEAMRNFIEDQTGDNAVCIVRAVIEAHIGGSPTKCTAPAPGSAQHVSQRIAP